jgi:hypothetical protein
MSAAATAAGYLYASGRLRGRQSKEHEDPRKPETDKREAHKPQEEVRVAAMPAEQDTRPRRQPTIQYRTRRWRPDDGGKPE